MMQALQFSWEACIIFSAHFIILGAGALLLGLNAPFAFSAEALPSVQFRIKPRLCVLAEGEELCRDELEITWHSEERRSLCLFRSDLDHPLRCWQGAHGGEHQVVISASRNVDFHLKEPDNETHLVSEAFEVVHDNSKFRRRRRNAWSFF